MSAFTEGPEWIDISPNSDGGILKKVTTPGDPSSGFAQAGNEVQAHYTGYLNDPSGDKFDSSVDRGQGEIDRHRCPSCPSSSFIHRRFI